VLFFTSENPAVPYGIPRDCQIETLPDILYDHFGDKRDGLFVEIGAFDGYTWSNTYGLAELGWHGILVEPQPDQYAKLVELYRDNPRVITENCAVGNRMGKVDLFYGGSIATILPEMVDLYHKMDQFHFVGLSKDKKVEVDLITLDHLMEKRQVREGFELLVIDVEGSEMDVLSGFSIEKYLPQMMIVETHEDFPDTRLSFKARRIYGTLRRHGYRKVYHDTINTIYWRKL
jgi:FkbM family methyltransferase